ncbi:MAG TPA: VWA domain-containing protein [Tepidisphaeraceae bacterium]|jgi:hypothetical protein
MTNWFLKLLNLPTSGGTRVVESEWVWGGGQIAWLILLAMALAGLTWWLYRRERDLSPARRWTMTALRVALFATLLLMIARPVLRFALEGDVRKSILLLIDSSASMSIVDPRSDAEDQRRVAIVTNSINAATPVTASTQPSGELPRFELVRQAMANTQLSLIERLSADYDLRATSFGDQLLDVPTSADQPLVAAIANLTPDRSTTAVGDAIRNAISKNRGQPLAGVFLITDGGSNAGSSPLVAAELAKREGVPIYAWGVGVTRLRDVAVMAVDAREVAFLDEDLSVSARVRTTGMAGQKIKVVARLDGKTVGEEMLTIEGDGEDVVQIPISADKAGQFNLTVSVDPLAVEAVKDNNTQSQALRVIEGKIKVLVIEQQPRWEYKYLQAMLARDRRVAAQFVLLEGDPAIADSPESPYLTAVPTDKDALFAYDVIIIGDVDPGAFSKENLASIEQFVSQFGGAIVMIAGRRFAPLKYAGTPIEKLLPVEFDAEGTTRGFVRSEKPIAVELTAAGKASGLLRLGDDDNASARVWSALPPLYWTARVTRPKPAAEVLLVDADSSLATRFGKMPIIATQQYGSGTTMFIGTDNLWRWRKNAGDRHYTRLWGQFLQRMALPHLLGENRRTQLTADKKSYSVGERMTVFARLYDKAFEPLTDPTVRGVLNREGGGAVPIILRRSPEQPGMYRAELTAPASGQYAFSIESDPATKLDLPVLAPRVEFADAAMNATLLQSIAEVSGGRFFREEDLHTLPDSISGKTEKVRSSVDVDIWASPIFFILILVLAGVEWAMRKAAYLK